MINLQNNSDTQIAEDLFRCMLSNIKNLNQLLKKENHLFQAKKLDVVVKLLYRKIKITKILEDIYISIKNFQGSLSANLKRQIILHQNIMKDLSNINRKYLEKEEIAIKAILEMIIQKKNATKKANKTYTDLHKMKACI